MNILSNQVFGTRNNKLANKNHKGEGEGTSMYSYTDWSDDTDKDPNYEPLARSVRIVGLI